MRPPGSLPDSPLPDPGVVVIGGGFAGLAAATALADAGVRVCVFEARPTLGGRANAFRDPATGERIDNGQHIIAGCYTETLAFLKRVGSAGRLHRPSTLHVPMIDERGRRTELTLPPLSGPLDVIAGILAWDALDSSDRWAMLRIGRALGRGSRVTAGETVRQWLVRHHQSPRLCRLFWEPLALAALNQPIDDASAEMFVAVTSRMFGPEPDAAAILVPAVPLDELYTIPAQQFLDSRGGRMHTHAKAAVVIEDDRVKGVTVGGAWTPASIVVCAVPWFAMTDVFTNPPRSLQPTVNNATALGSAPIVTVNLWFEDFQLDDAMLGLPGRTFQWIFDRRRFVGSGQSHLSLVSSGADATCDLSNGKLIALALDEVRQALAAARRSTVRHASVIRERRATFSLKPGSPPRPGTTTAVTGLFLAGDWIDTGLPATIESAVLSGHRAAAAVLCLLSLRTIRKSR
ncbi:MAG TPA: hydroxysqualene dehydroxylase HpnE [Vicinamibacterales bacterium]|nr:hydroxysqualene dehydroxylase HpnE [Vicinamibacterales bacterium]